MEEQDLDHPVSTLTSRESKELRSLGTRRGRARTGRFVAEGVRVVEDLLASDFRVRWVACASSLEDSARGAALRREVELQGLVRRVLPDREFAGIADTESSQGVIAIAEIPDSATNVLDSTATPAVVLVLDGVQDPGNFGTLVRSAEALGALAVVALTGTVDPWNPKAVRAAAGSSFRLPLIRADAASGVAMLRSRGFSLLGAAAGGRPIHESRSDRVALVVGNEGAGLSEEIAAGLDDLVGIPLRGRAESLNVAAAAAILLYELTR